jgi:hypothetical protein
VHESGILGGFQSIGMEDPNIITTCVSTGILDDLGESEGGTLLRSHYGRPPTDGLGNPTDASEPLGHKHLVSPAEAQSFLLHRDSRNQEEPRMRASITKNGLTLRVIAGTHSALLGIDLQENKRKGCLGFSIRRTDVKTEKSSWLPNMLRFPGDKSSDPATTETAPLQKFRWGDYTIQPASAYRYQVIPRYGQPAHLTTRDELAEGVTVEVTSKDQEADETAVFFNRAAAASRAFGE